MYSIALDQKCFKWKKLSLSGPKALLFLQLLIVFITRSAVNVRVISIGFLLVSLVTNRVSIDEEGLPSFEVLNCLLKLATSCLDDEIEISFSAVRFVLQSIPLMVLHSLVRFVFWSMFSTKSQFSRLCSGCLYSVLAVHTRLRLFFGGRVVWSSRPVSLLVQVPYGVCDAQ